MEQVEASSLISNTPSNKKIIIWYFHGSRLMTPPHLKRKIFFKIFNVGVHLKKGGGIGYSCSRILSNFIISLIYCVNVPVDVGLEFNILLNPLLLLQVKLLLPGQPRQSINQSESIDRSIDQSINQSINQSIDQSMNRSINRSIDQSID